ncbi:MAG: metallophosphoesterase [Bacteroidaceae bacterium]|nr:metallophosphoesterase [Bacteroidaceae bacterium]
MNKNRILGLLVMALFAVSSFAQMTFTFAEGKEATYSEMSDGSYLVQLPAGIDLNSAITGVKVADKAVDAASVAPNPTTTFITDGEIETFVYDGKAYSFRFIAGEYFTAVFFSDPHVGQIDYDGLSVDDMKTYVNNIVNMGKDGGKVVTFDKAPKGFVPTADIVFCLGDMDKDKASGDDFKTAIAGFNTAGIPFITMAGNHDLSPDLWDDGSKGVTWGINDGGAYYDGITLDLITAQNNTAATNGGFTIKTFTQSGGDVQIKPFTFTFKGVDFYCGQTYWFQKPYDAPSLVSATKFYAPDGIIDALNEYVEGREGKAAIWMQHYPFNYGSDCDRWWLNQNASGNSLDSEVTSAYTTAAQKKDKLVEIISKTKNPVHFSGHVHSTATNTYSTLTDYTIDNAVSKAAYVVLCKEGVGVVEVKAVTF